MTPEDRIAQLENQVGELLAWKKEREAQILKSPLDKQSEDVLIDKGFPLVVDRNLATVTATSAISITVGGQKYQINVL